MAIIDPEGLFEGERLAACSDIAQLYWQRLFLASNTCGRLELSYPSIISRVFKSFRNIPAQPELWEVFEEFEKNFLAILYQADGIWWCQFITSEKNLPKYKKARDEATPAPTQEMVESHRNGYLEWRKRNSFSNQSFRNSSESFQRRGLGEEKSGVGEEKRGEKILRDEREEHNPKESVREDAKKEKKAPDERHTPFRQAVENYWDAKHPDIRMTWDASEAKVLSLLLKANPQLQLDAFVGLLRNRFRSDVNHSERPRQWLDKITNYAGGPLNEFKNPKGPGTSGNTNKSQQRWNGNAASLQEFAAAREVDCGGASEAGGSAPGSGEPRGPGNLFGPSVPVPHGGHPGSMRHALPDETQ